MPCCAKCQTWLPPGFVHDTHPISGEVLLGKLCTFCLEDKKVIPYGEGKQITKKELEKEYKIFMAKIKEKNQLLKDGVKGNRIIV
jgi:hypothetical protein